MSRCKFAIGVLALLALIAVPSPWVSTAAAADNPTAADVFAGDSYLRATGTLGGQLHFRLALVDDASSTAASHRAGWDHAPGVQYTFTWRTWATGTAPPILPDGDGSDNCRAEIRSEATVVATLFTGVTCPATGSTYTWTPTAAGTYRMFATAVQTNELTNNYNVATGSGGVIDYGALRVGLAVSLAHAGYPAGALHAYTVVGETVGLTVGHTAVAANQPTSSVVLKAIDAANAQVKTATVSLAGTSTATSFSVDDAWPAAACSCGFELQVTATMAFTGTQWTHVASATSPAVVASEFVARRTAAYNVDARITATHLLQPSALYGTPPMSNNDPDDARYSNDLAYTATRLTNARGEGLVGAGLQFTSTLRDNALVVPIDSRSQGTGLTVATQGGEAGWGPMRLWNDGAPTGAWTKTIDVTAPATIDADTHLIASTKAYTVATPEGGGSGMGDPLKLFVSPIEAGPSSTVQLAASEAFLDGTARTGNAADTLVYVYDPNGDLVVNGAATTELHDGIYTYILELNETPAAGHWVAVVETSDPDTMDPVTTSTTFLVRGNATSTAVVLEDIWAETLLPVLWLAIMWFAVWRSDTAGIRYGLMILFALIGFLAVMLDELSDEWRIAALFGVALGIFWVGLANRFGARRRDPAKGDKPA